MTKRAATRRPEANPYAKVWNSVEDEEASILKWMKSGTLFVLTHEELARRYKDRAHYLLSRARKAGRTAEGYAAFEEALYYRNAAFESLQQHREVLIKSKPRLITWWVKTEDSNERNLDGRIAS